MNALAIAMKSGYEIEIKIARHMGLLNRVHIVVKNPDGDEFEKDTGIIKVNEDVLPELINETIDVLVEKSIITLAKDQKTLIGKEKS